MGKSNNLHHESKKVYKKENNLNNFLKEDEIQILENINIDFIKKFIIDFSNFIKNNVRLLSHSIKIGTYDLNKTNSKNSIYFSSVEILPCKSQYFIIFPYDFLSVIIDLLFGGRGKILKEFNKVINITSTEYFINEKIMKFITSIFSNICKKHLLPEMNFNDAKFILDLKKYNDFDSNKIFSIHYFNFNINNIEIFFSILIPLSIVKKLKNKKIFSISRDNKKKYIESETSNVLSLNDIYNVELDIVSRIIGISISHEKINTLSIGDILSIKKPDKILALIENKPIFFASYKRFNEQSIIFIEEFIDSNSESDKDKEHSDE